MSRLSLIASFLSLALAQNSIYNESVACDVGSSYNTTESTYENATGTWVQRDGENSTKMIVRCPEPVVECKLICNDCNDTSEFEVWPAWFVNYSEHVVVNRKDLREWDGLYWLDCSTDFDSYFRKWLGFGINEWPTFRLINCPEDLKDSRCVSWKNDTAVSVSNDTAVSLSKDTTVSVRNLTVSVRNLTISGDRVSEIFNLTGTPTSTPTGTPTSTPTVDLSTDFEERLLREITKATKYDPQESDSDDHDFLRYDFLGGGRNRQAHVTRAEALEIFQKLVQLDEARERYNLTKSLELSLELFEWREELDDRESKAFRERMANYASASSHFYPSFPALSLITTFLVVVALSN